MLNVFHWFFSSRERKPERRQRFILSVEELERRDAPSATPLTLTGFNQDVIFGATESNAMAGTTQGMDIVDQYVLGETGAATSPSALTAANGLPASGTFTSAANANVPFTLQSYTADNDLQLTSESSTGALTLQTPMSGITTLHILAASTFGPTTVNFTLNFAGGSTTTVSGVTVADWTNDTTSSAITGLARINRTSSSTIVDNTGTLQEIDIPPWAPTPIPTSLRSVLTWRPRR